jgi:hypothetical protein
VEGSTEAPSLVVALSMTVDLIEVCRCFCIDKMQVCQDYAFLTRGGLANYKAHYLLSWFSPLLGGNGPTSSGLILKINSGYNGGEQSALEIR